MNESQKGRTVRLTNIKGADGSEMYADGMENVGDNRKKNANFLYKQYVKWHKSHPDGKPTLSFKEWLHWAQNKGIAKKRHFGADASEVKEPHYRADEGDQETTVAEDKVVTAPPTQGPKVHVLGKAKKIVSGLAVVTVAALFLYAVASSSEKAHAGVPVI